MEIRFRRVGVLLLVFSIFVSPYQAQTRDDSFQTQADAYLRSYAEQGRFRGSVLISSNGSVTFEKSFIIVLSNVEDAPVRAIANDLGSLLLDGKVQKQ